MLAGAGRTLVSPDFVVAGSVGLALPGPVAGVGLKETILTLVTDTPIPFLKLLLYEGPSPLPVLWADLLRFLPCAVVVLWPVLRLLPRELRDSTRLDCPRPTQELRFVVWPLTARACGICTLVVMALSLRRNWPVAMSVETPGWETFAHVLFDRMHYGVQNEVAALCLVLLLGLGLVTVLLLAVGRLRFAVAKMQRET